MSRNGVPTTPAPLWIRIRPAFSTMKSRLLPSPAFASATGSLSAVAPVRGVSAIVWAAAGPAQASAATANVPAVLFLMRGSIRPGGRGRARHGRGGAGIQPGMGGSSGPFHSGEIAVQRRTGVAEEARAVGAIVSGAVSPAVARFLRDQRLAIMGSLDARGRPWASVATGPAGF